MEKAKKLISLIFSLKYINFTTLFILNNRVRISDAKKVYVHPSAKIKDSNITIKEGSTLIIHEGVNLSNVNVHVEGTLIIGCNSIINNGYLGRKVNLSVNRGKVTIGEYNRLQCDIRVRYNGNLNIGNRNNINSESEIRCDEKIDIGHYNQISYRVMIWDTNTHTIYPPEKRRELTDNHYPIFGYEYEKPKTKPIKLGSDCWISKDVTLLKGTEIANKCIIGYGTLLSNFKLPSSTSAVIDYPIKTFNNNL